MFAKQFLRPRQSGAHGTCHACHTLDTPLEKPCTCSYTRAPCFFLTRSCAYLNSLGKFGFRG